MKKVILIGAILIILIIGFVMAVESNVQEKYIKTDERIRIVPVPYAIEYINNLNEKEYLDIVCQRNNYGVVN